MFIRFRIRGLWKIRIFFKIIILEVFIWYRVLIDIKIKILYMKFEDIYVGKVEVGNLVESISFMLMGFKVVDWNLIRLVVFESFSIM